MITDARSNVTTFIYDANNRLLSTTIPLTGTQTATTSYGYDSVSNRTVITDAMGSVSTFAYDALNRLVSGTIPLTGTQTALTRYGYDAVGNRTVITDANSHVTRYGYDALNRVTAVTDPLTHTTSYGYDAVSNRTVITDARGAVSLYAYDKLNRVISTTLPLTGTQTALTQYGYDAVSNRTIVTDANSHITLYGFDALNRTTVITDALTNATGYGYDAVSNRTVITDALGNSMTYVYDAVNRVITTTNALGKSQGYSYDAVGNRLTFTDELMQITRYVYDKARRLISVTDPLTQTTTYGYDAVGNTTAITNSTGLVTSFVYDAANRVTSKTTPIGTTGYTYDGVNNMIAVTNSSLATQAFTYDATNQVTQEDDRAAGGALIVSYLYGYDANGNRTSETERRTGTPDRVTNYTYDKANRLITTSDPNSNTTTYAYDAVGNQTGVTKTMNSSVTYTATLDYDRQNRIRQFCASAGGCSTLSYLGNSDWLAYVLDQYGNVAQRYFYANGRPLRVDFPSTFGFPQVYYRYNWHGDVAALVQKNGDGAVTWTNYGAWGDLYDAYPQQPYNWNGGWGYMKFPNQFNINQNDGLDIGLYYVHGRWYNQDTGLYLSPDDKGSYIYIDNDPINKHVDAPPPRANLPSECVGGMTNNDPRDLTCWLFRALKKNLDNPTLQEVRRLVGQSRQGAPHPEAFSQAWQAKELFVRELVGPLALWDYKRTIERRLGLAITLCGKTRCWLDVENSVPGNINFGFVASEAGYSLLGIQAGAGYAEATDPSHDEEQVERLNREHPGLNLKYTGKYDPAGKFYSWISPFGTETFNLGDEPEDNEAVQFGIDLYDHFDQGRTLTFAAFQLWLEQQVIGFQSHEPDPRPVQPDIAVLWPYAEDYFDYRK